MKNLILFIFFVFNLAGTINGQKILTLEESLKIALGQSYGIKTATLSLNSSQSSLEAAKLGLMSSVNLEFDLPNYARRLSSQFDPAIGSEQFFQVGYTTLEGRLFINQPILFSNGTVSLIGSLFGRDQFSGLTGTKRDYFSNLSIRLRQPLFIFNSQKANLERSEINLEKAKRNYTQTERDIIYNVTAAFFNLYKAKKNVEISAEKVKQTEDSYTTASNKFKAGLIAEVEALQLEVDLAASRNELLNSERNFEELRNDFKLLIGLDINEAIDVIASIRFVPVELEKEAIINSALKNRPDLLNAEDDIRLQEMTVDEVDSRRTFKAELNANYGINKNDEEFNRIFNNFQDTRSVTFTVSVPVWDWGQNSREVEAAEADFRQQKLRYDNIKESLIKELISAINRVISAAARVEVLGKSVEVAEKSFNISLERFKAGTITSFDLSQVQLRLTDTKQSSLNALIDYNIALADLERKSFLTLR